MKKHNVPHVTLINSTNGTKRSRAWVIVVGPGSFASCSISGSIRVNGGGGPNFGFCFDCRRQEKKKKKEAIRSLCSVLCLILLSQGRGWKWNKKVVPRHQNALDLEKKKSSFHRSRHDQFVISHRHPKDQQHKSCDDACEAFPRTHAR